MSSVGAARKVSPNWSHETMTCHLSNCLGSGKRTFGDFSSEQLPHDLTLLLRRRSVLWMGLVGFGGTSSIRAVGPTRITSA